MKNAAAIEAAMRRVVRSGRRSPASALARIAGARRVVDRYRGRYNEGYDVLRARNFERLKAKGILPSHANVAAAHPDIHLS